MKYNICTIVNILGPIVVFRMVQRQIYDTIVIFFKKGIVMIHILSFWNTSSSCMSTVHSIMLFYPSVVNIQLELITS